MNYVQILIDNLSVKSPSIQPPCSPSILNCCLEPQVRFAQHSPCLLHSLTNLLAVLSTFLFSVFEMKVPKLLVDVSLSKVAVADKAHAKATVVVGF